MNDIVKAAGTALSTDVASKLLKGIGESRASTPKAGGEPLLRMLRSGEWVYGQEDTEVLEGSLWAVNPLSIQHGWSCWTNYDPKEKKKNELLGEAMGPIYESKPDRPEPINGYPFKEQRSFSLKCMNGDDEGVEVVHKLSSVGGMRAFDGLLADMQAQLRDNPAFPCPVIELEVDSYQHKQWGKTYVPIYKLQGWCDMAGTMSDQAEAHGEGEQVQAAREAAPAPVEPEPTQRRRRSTAQAEPAAQPAPEVEHRGVDTNAEVVSPAPARTGMPRRRPGQR